MSGDTPPDGFLPIVPDGLPRGWSSRAPEEADVDEIIALVRAEKRAVEGSGTVQEDVIAGEAAGVLTCAVTYGYGKPETLLAENPDYTIDHFEQLFDLVQVAPD